MNEYLLCVIGTVLLSAVLTAIAPEGKTASVIKGTAKLVCILAIVAPVMNFFATGEMQTEKMLSTGENSTANFSQIGIQTDEAFIKYYSEMRIRQTQTALEEELLNDFNAKTTVLLDWERKIFQSRRYEEGAVCITRINVTCKNEIGEEVKQKMWEHLKTNYCSEVLIE